VAPQGNSVRSASPTNASSVGNIGIANQISAAITPTQNTPAIQLNTELRPPIRAMGQPYDRARTQPARNAETVCELSPWSRRP